MNNVKTVYNTPVTNQRNSLGHMGNPQNVATDWHRGHSSPQSILWSRPVYFMGGRVYFIWLGADDALHLKTAIFT